MSDAAAFPMSVADFNKGNYLQRTDVCLLRGHTLNFIEAGYDWTTCWGIAKGVLLARLFGRKDEVPHAFAKALNKAQSRGGLAPGNFVCSGLVQYGYLRTLRDLATGPNATI